jgi:hypothetical protein
MLHLSFSESFIITKVKLKLWVCVHVCSLIAREGVYQFVSLSQTWHANALRAEKVYRKIKTPKSFLGSSPGEDDFRSSETKHDRKTTQILLRGKEVFMFSGMLF